MYEGYGPAGVAVLCDIMTDNRNRTAPEIRKLFEVHGGKLGATNCVAWMFERKGLFVFPADQVGEERLMEVALEAGADDIRREGTSFEVTCDPESYNEVAEQLAAAGLEPEDKELTRIPTNTVDLSVDDARKVLRLMESLDDHDDIQNVAANFNIPDEVLAELEASE